MSFLCYFLLFTYCLVVNNLFEQRGTLQQQDITTYFHLHQSHHQDITMADLTFPLNTGTKIPAVGYGTNSLSITTPHQFLSI